MLCEYQFCVSDGEEAFITLSKLLLISTFLFKFSDRASWSCPGWPWTYYVSKAGLEPVGLQLWFFHLSSLPFSSLLSPHLLQCSPVLALTNDDSLSIFCLKNTPKHLSIGVSLPSLLTVAFMSSLFYYSLLQIETHEIGLLSWELSLPSLSMFMYLRRIPCFHRCFI